MPSHSIDGVMPVADPTAYVHRSAVLVGDVGGGVNGHIDHGAVPH